MLGTQFVHKGILQSHTPLFEDLVSYCQFRRYREKHPRPGAKRYQRWKQCNRFLCQTVDGSLFVMRIGGGREHAVFDKLSKSVGENVAGDPFKGVG